jgi:hypothetical protein
MSSDESENQKNVEISEATKRDNYLKNLQLLGVESLEGPLNTPFLDEVLPKKRGRPPKGDHSTEDHRRHHSAVYYVVDRLLKYFMQPKSIAEAMEYLNTEILPSIGSAPLEKRAVFRLIRDLRGLSIKTTEEYSNDSEEIQEEWRAFLKPVEKNGRTTRFQYFGQNFANTEEIQNLKNSVDRHTQSLVSQSRDQKEAINRLKIELDRTSQAQSHFVNQLNRVQQYMEYSTEKHFETPKKKIPEFKFVSSSSLLPRQNDLKPSQIIISTENREILNFLLDQKQLDPQYYRSNQVKITALQDDELMCWLYGRKELGHLEFEIL